MRIFVLPRAEEDISESALYIAEDSLEAAIHFIDRTNETFEFLSSHPEAGSEHSFLSPSLKGTRSWPVRGFEKWLVFYQLHTYEIVVIRILHGARDIDNLL